jgi:FkbM family methyltransferase
MQARETESDRPAGGRRGGGRVVRKTIAGVLVVVALLAFRSWLGTSGGLAVRHRLQSWVKPLAAVTTIEVEGVGTLPMFLNPDDAVITPWFLSGRPWEATETHWFIRALRPGDTVVDVGANIGYYTLVGARIVGETGRVYAFEPDPLAFEILERNVRLNRLENVVLEQKAVSNAPGTLRLFLAELNKGDHRIYQPEGEQRPYVEVDAVALDEYLGDRAVDFIKVDTQGAEALILEGMERLVRNSESLVLALEYSPRHLIGLGSSPEQMLDRIESLDLRLFDLGMGGTRVRPLRSVTPAQLLRRFGPRSELFTNLLLVKGRPDLLAEIDEDSISRLPASRVVTMLLCTPECQEHEANQLPGAVQ